MIELDIKQEEHFDIYIFGSALYSESHSDIDIAIVYDKEHISVQEAINFRSNLLQDLAEQTTYRIDTILLSVEEEKETEFLTNAKHKKILK